MFRTVIGRFRLLDRWLGVLEKRHNNTTVDSKQEEMIFVVKELYQNVMTSVEGRKVLPLLCLALFHLITLFTNTLVLLFRYKYANTIHHTLT